MAESADDPASTGSSRRSAASFRSTRSTSRAGSPAPSAPTRFDGPGRSRLRRRDRRLRRAEAGPRPDLDQRPHPPLYGELFDLGHCHTVEVYDGDELVGGPLWRIARRAFFGESMFHRARDASKVALVHLVARLRAGGYRLLDTQFVTDHLRTFGAVEVPQRRYQRLLEEALTAKPICRPRVKQTPGGAEC